MSAVPTIMLLGDSLTAPYAPTVDRLLTEAKVPHKLVGTQGSGSVRHEGHGGYRVQRLADNLAGYLSTIGAVPDVTVLCAGTNDVVSMPFPDVDGIATQWQNLVAALRARGSRVLACTMPPTTIANSPGLQPLNVKIRDFVRRNPIRLRLADVGAQIGTGELVDGVHLTAAGAEHMGRIVAHGLSTRVPLRKVASNPIAKAADELKRRRTTAIVAVGLAAAALYWLK